MHVIPRRALCAPGGALACLWVHEAAADGWLHFSGGLPSAHRRWRSGRAGLAVVFGHSNRARAGICVAVRGTGNRPSCHSGIERGAPTASAFATSSRSGALRSVQHVNRHGPTTAGGGSAAKCCGPVIFTLERSQMSSVEHLQSLLTPVAQTFERATPEEVRSIEALVE